MRFEQDFQALTGTLTTRDGRTLPVQGSVKADRVRFVVGLDTYEGRVRGKQMSGQASGGVSGFWKAARLD